MSQQHAGSLPRGTGTQHAPQWQSAAAALQGWIRSTGPHSSLLNGTADMTTHQNVIDENHDKGKEGWNAGKDPCQGFRQAWSRVVFTTATPFWTVGPPTSQSNVNFMTDAQSCSCASCNQWMSHGGQMHPRFEPRSHHGFSHSTFDRDQKKWTQHGIVPNAAKGSLLEKSQRRATGIIAKRPCVLTGVEWHQKSLPGTDEGGNKITATQTKENSSTGTGFVVGQHHASDARRTQATEGGWEKGKCGQDCFLGIRSTGNIFFLHLRHVHHLCVCLLSASH